MSHKMTLLRDFVRESIGHSTEVLAARVALSSGRITAVIYDAGQLLNMSELINRSAGQDFQSLRLTLAKDVVRGFIEVGPPQLDGVRGRCHDAWMVYRAAGPGYGKIVYGVGYALSPSGRLMSDRGSVSNSAIEGWRKQSVGGRKRLRLDDVDHNHKKPGNEYHTEDPEDDCEVFTVFSQTEPLNYAYTARREEHSILDQLRRAHEEVMSAFDFEISQRVSDLIFAGGERFFFEKYNS